MGRCQCMYAALWLLLGRRTHLVLQAFVEFVDKYFVESAAQERVACIEDQQHSPSAIAPTQQIVLSRIFVYPIKSCAAMCPDSWRIGPHGLLYDREWTLVDAKGVALGGKRVCASWIGRVICLIVPVALMCVCVCDWCSILNWR
jgi:hypothetical protein